MGYVKDCIVLSGFRCSAESAADVCLDVALDGIEEVLPLERIGEDLLIIEAVGVSTTGNGLVGDLYIVADIFDDEVVVEEVIGVAVECGGESCGGIERHLACRAFASFDAGDDSDVNTCGFGEFGLCKTGFFAEVI